MSNPVGDMILEAMKLSKTNQSKVCHATGLKKAYLNMIISGKRNLTPEAAKKLNNALEHFDGKKAVVAQYENCEI